MLKIKSNLKINGIHWGLAFVDGVAYTANASLAAKLLLKGYVVTDQPVAGDNIIKQESSQIPSLSSKVVTDHSILQPDQPVAGPIITEHEPSTSPSTVEQQTPATQPEQSLSEQPPAITPVETPTENPTEVRKPKPTRPRKKVVTADAADESRV